MTINPDTLSKIEMKTDNISKPKTEPKWKPRNLRDDPQWQGHFNAILTGLYSSCFGPINWNSPPEPEELQKLGNTFDTMVDFLEVIDGSSAGTVVKLVLQQYTASLNQLGGYNAAWFDDFGWWSVASQRATVSSAFNPDAKKAFSKSVGVLAPLHGECALRVGSPQAGHVQQLSASGGWRCVERGPERHLADLPWTEERGPYFGNVGGN